MKKLFTLLSLFTISVSFAQNQLPNIGFENWTTTTIYENPDQWSSSNYAEYATANCQKSTDAQHLSYSALLQTTLVGTDTAFAYVYLGETDQNGPSAGIPYSTSVNQLKGYYKYNLASGDSAMALVIKFSGGSMVSIDMFPITGVQNSWTAFTYSINPAAQDSIFIAFISTNPFVYPSYAVPGSYLMVDNISLAHSVNGPGPALPNFSFENWTPVSYTDPDGWESFNALLTPLGLNNVSSTSDAFAGSLAAQLQTIFIPQFGDTLPGNLYFGDIDQSGQPLAVPFTGTPATLTGQYKYQPAGGDLGYAAMEFYQNGSIIGGNIFAFTTSATYSSFSITTNLSGTPDSAIVVFSSGNNPGSTLKLDNVQFNGGNTGVEEIVPLSFNVYPNPVSDYVFIEFADGIKVMNVEITDMQGRVVLSQQVNSRKTELDVRSLSPGIYMVSLSNAAQKLTKPFSVVR
ncbi:MAG: T9SS type A sorting domain-containing protein [Bacteroidota bacterium]